MAPARSHGCRCPATWRVGAQIDSDQRRNEQHQDPGRNHDADPERGGEGDHERCLGLRFHDKELLLPGPYEASGPRVFASAELDPGRRTVWGFSEPSPRLPRGRPTQKRRKRIHGRNNGRRSLINADALRQGLAEGELPGLPLGRSHQNRHPAPDGGRSEYRAGDVAGSESDSWC